MMNIDLTPLRGNDIEFEKLFSSVKELYACNWDDSVHDSYGRFVDQAQERSNALHTILCKAELLVNDIKDLDIDGLVEKAELLCKEAASI